MNVKASNLEKVVSFLESDRYLVFDYNEAIKTPLHIAVQYSEIEIIKCILSKKPNVNHLDGRGKPALYYAMKRSFKSAIV